LLAPTFQQLRAFGASDDPADVVLSAILLRDLDAYNEALRAFRRLATMLPQEPAVHLGLAECYRAAGRIEEARDAERRGRGLLPAPDQSGTTRDLHNSLPKARPPMRRGVLLIGLLLAVAGAPAAQEQPPGARRTVAEGERALDRLIERCAAEGGLRS